MIVPGGGLAPDGSRWISCKPNFLLPVRVLSKLFRRLMLEKLAVAHKIALNSIRNQPRDTLRSSAPIFSTAIKSP